MKHAKDGPQLTGAQALDALDLILKNRIKEIGVPALGTYFSGKYLAYHTILDIVETMRYEKFNDPPTENPMKVLAESKSYEI